MAALTRKMWRARRDYSRLRRSFFVFAPDRRRATGKSCEIIVVLIADTLGSRSTILNIPRNRTHGARADPVARTGIRGLRSMSIVSRLDSIPVSCHSPPSAPAVQKRALNARTSAVLASV
jgi:hypothetical protein